MNMCIRCVLLVTAVVVLSCLPDVVNGADLTVSDVLYDVPGSGGLYGPIPPAAWTGTGLGYQSVGGLFEAPASPITVRALGFFDYGNDGLAVAHNVAIFGSADGVNLTLLEMVTVPAGTAAPLELGYRWANLSFPVSIASGTFAYYTVAGSTIESDGDAWWVGANQNAAISTGYSDGRYTTSAWPSGPGTHGGGVLCPANLSTAALSIAEPPSRFVTYDDFETGTEPDGGLWMPVSANTASVNAGALVLDATAFGGGAIGVRSKATFGYGRYRFVLSSFNGGSTILGVNDYAVSGDNYTMNAIYLRDEGGGSIYTNSTSVVATPSGWQPSGTPVTYTFVYRADEVAIYRGSILLLQETDTAKIPQDAAMRFEALTYNGGILGIDSVSFEPPQPVGTVVTIK